MWQAMSSSRKNDAVSGGLGICRGRPTQHSARDSMLGSPARFSGSAFCHSMLSLPSLTLVFLLSLPFLGKAVAQTTTRQDAPLSTSKTLHLPAPGAPQHTNSLPTA